MCAEGTVTTPSSRIARIRGVLALELTVDPLSEPALPSTEYRSIELTVHRPGVRVLARRGYSGVGTSPIPPMKVSDSRVVHRIGRVGGGWVVLPAVARSEAGQVRRRAFGAVADNLRLQS